MSGAGLQAGDLRDRVAFDSPTLTPNGYGGQIAGWAHEFDRAGQMRWLRGGETVQAARLAGRSVVVVTVRASVAAHGIGTDWRLRDLRRGDLDAALPGEIYNIRSVAPSEDRAWIEITCESGVAT